jgi:membrane protein required for beta-lactamase induction
MKRTIAALVLMAFLPVSTTGCFGGFQLTRKVYDFNREVSPDKWVRELVFLAMAIVPVYGAATFLDAVIFNSVEFWTGSNPVLAKNGASRKITTADGTAVLTRTSENRLDVRIEAADGRSSRFVMQREGDGFSARTPEGALIARVAEVDGEPMLFHSEG